MKYFRYLALSLLVINGLSALGGGLMLMLDPTGGLIQLPFFWIENSYFGDYFIPGLLLFIFNGILSSITFMLTLIRKRRFEKWIVIQGVILMMWIFTQVMILHMIYFLHYIMMSAGILLVLSGMVLMRQDPARTVARR